MHNFSRIALLAAATALTPPVLAAPAQSVPIPTLVKQVSIPHATFRLKNGLTVVVHEDHKTPIVSVVVWYNVGSKDEPPRKEGFAHLYEHLMFNGSENLPGDYFTYLQQIGATDYNGTTSYDRTNYFETVPAGALERALFMESDRMGHLLGAVTQGVMDNQRAVVENEKRQGDSRPGGLLQYQLFGGLFPPGHPYHHTTIGSVQDLDAARLADVKAWFRARYGPDNAVLVIAGDVTAAQAKPLVEKYFGDIPRGPVNSPAMAGVPTLAKPKSIAMHDHVATTIIQKYWAVPGLLDRRLAALDIGGSVLGGLASSRLDKIMVREEGLAVAVSASLSPLQRAGIFSVSAYVKPGVDPAKVSRRLDEILADYIAKGPSRDEVERAVMSEVSGRIRGLEQVGGFSGKGQTLAEGQTLAHDSDYYKKTLATYAAITPAAVRTQMQQWLRRPALTITMSPGEREAYVEPKAVEPPKQGASKSEGAAKGNRPIPPIGQLAALDFPEITHTKLSNGIPLEFVQRRSVPVTQVAMAFDAGSATDSNTTHGLAAMAMSLLDEGTSKLSSQEVAETEERLGADVSSSNGSDQSFVELNALSPNLAPSLDLMSSVTRDAAFRPADIERIRAQTLTAIAQTQKDPTRVARRLLPIVLYGPNHPYGGPGGGDPKAIAKFSRADLVAFEQRWLRPDNVRIYVVSDRPISEVQPLLEERFGNWTAPGGPRPLKAFTPPPPRPSSPKILLINLPGSPQSSIVGGQLLPLDPKGDLVPFDTANDVLGGTFLSRLNMDIREEKGWSYGVSGDEQVMLHAVPYVVSAPVQADRTGDSLLELNKQLTDFLSTRGVTREEMTRTVASRINALPGELETSGSVLGSIMEMDLLNRPDNYYETLPPEYRSLTTAKLDQAARAALDPKGFTWIVVGDAAKVRPQLEKLGMPIEVVEAP
ncbi:M16 family metallopeptidase [Sphingomonas sp.]|uniref:M16 family metallopeptidase n=1 Tax=Sphingomonas sp. TaxID=28214 RepID=UPI0038A262D3